MAAPGLPSRDRDIVTVSTPIGRHQTIEMARYFDLAFGNGVRPEELSGIITDLAITSGRAGPTPRSVVAGDILARRSSTSPA